MPRTIPKTHTDSPATKLISCHISLKGTLPDHHFGTYCDLTATVPTLFFPDITRLELQAIQWHHLQMPNFEGTNRDNREIPIHIMPSPRPKTRISTRLHPTITVSFVVAMKVLNKHLFTWRLSSPRRFVQKCCNARFSIANSLA
jgi:hypothetical protein